MRLLAPSVAAVGGRGLLVVPHEPPEAVNRDITDERRANAHDDITKQQLRTGVAGKRPKSGHVEVFYGGGFQINNRRLDSEKPVNPHDRVFGGPEDGHIGEGIAEPGGDDGGGEIPASRDTDRSREKTLQRDREHGDEKPAGQTIGHRAPAQMPEVAVVNP